MTHESADLLDLYGDRTDTDAAIVRELVRQLTDAEKRLRHQKDEAEKVDTMLKRAGLKIGRVSYEVSKRFGGAYDYRVVMPVNDRHEVVTYLERLDELLALDAQAEEFETQARHATEELRARMEDV